MKTRHWLVLPSTFVSAVCAHAAQAPDFTAKILKAGSSLEIEAVPPAGHHVNVGAPMSAFDSKQSIAHKPAKAQPVKVLFRVPHKGPNEYAIALFLCDDAKTFCERHQVSLKWEGNAEHKNHSEPQVRPKNAKDLETPWAINKSSASKKNHGFHVNDPKAALAEAARRNTPLLIDFFGIWCPPCNQLDELVFSSSEFKQAAKDFVKLKLDADSEISWELKSKYKVAGYPTVIFAAADGEEISRIVGFRPRADFVVELSNAWRFRHEPYSKMKAKADAGDAEASARVGMVHFERQEYDQAKAYLSKSPAHQEHLMAAEIALAENKANPSALRVLLERAISQYEASTNAIEWRIQLADLHETEKKMAEREQVLEAALKNASELIDHPEKLKGRETSIGDLWAVRANIEEKLGRSDRARKDWAEGAKWYRQQLKSLSHKNAVSERGFNLELAYCLWKSGDVAAANSLYKTLEVRYPREFTFHYNHANMNFDLKNYSDSVKQAAKAYEHSYGDNKLRAAHLLARAHDALGSPAKGREIVQTTLKNLSLPSDPGIRTHRYVKKLQELDATLKKKTNYGGPESN